MFMQRIATVALLIMISSATLAGSIDSELLRNGLVAQESPAGGITYEKIHLGSYKVTAEKESLSIALLPQNQNEETPTTLELDGYRLEGTDNGEWGGKLTAIDSSGKSTTLLKENVINIYKFQGDVFVFTGLAHLGGDRGAMYKLTNANGRLKLERTTLLPSSPIAVTSDDRFIYILTFSGLVVVNPSTERAWMRILANNAPWNHYAPNSLVKFGNLFVVGMHSGVAVVTVDDYWDSSIIFYGK